MATWHSVLFIQDTIIYLVYEFIFHDTGMGFTYEHACIAIQEDKCGLMEGAHYSTRGSKLYGSYVWVQSYQGVVYSKIYGVPHSNHTHY